MSIHLTSVQVMISRSVGSSPTSGSLLSAQSLLRILCPPLCAPPLLALSPKINKFRKKRKEKKRKEKEMRKPREPPDACAQRKDHVKRRQEKTVICNPRRETSEKINPASTWILDSQPPKL